MTTSVEAVFILEPIGVDGKLEANGEVLYFCSGKCLSKYCKEELDTYCYEAGKSADWEKGTVCDQCGSPVEHTP